MNDTCRSAMSAIVRSTTSFLGPTLPVALALCAGISQAQDASRMVLKTEHFDRDPGWQGYNNRIVPKVIASVAILVDFGDLGSLVSSAFRATI